MVSMLKNSKNNIHIGMAARMTKDKRQDLILRIINNNKEFFLKKKVYFSLLGEGDCFDKHKKFINNHKLKNIVKIPGYYNETKLIKWFRSLDLYLHLSDDETTSTSLLQAMSMSLPILCSNVEGNKMLLRNKNLIIVENNEKKILNKLKKLLNNKTLRNILARNARKVVEKHYNAKNLFNNYIKFISK